MLIGIFLFGVGAILSFASGIRALQASRRWPDYRQRQKYMVRARGSLIFSLLSGLMALAVLVLGQATQVPGAPAPVATQATSTLRPGPSPTLTASHTASPNTPTAIPATPSPTITPTAGLTATPALPMAVQALVEGSATPAFPVQFGRLRFSTAIQGYQLIAPGNSFHNPIKHMYAVFTYQPIGTLVPWSALWYQNGLLKHIDTTSWNAYPSGVGVTDWAQDPALWQEGSYEVQIFLGNSWVASGNFGLVGAPPTSTATLPPTNSPTPRPSATATSSPAATWTPLPTATPRPTSTLTPVPTETNTPLPTPTRTPRPTATQTLLPTATHTPLPTASHTPAPTATRTPLPTATHTLVPTATRTPLPTATSTPVPTATRTPRPTLAPQELIKPTATPSPTATKTPPPTSTPRPSNTPTPTRTPAPTLTPPPTSTPRPTNTPTPTRTPLPTATLIPSPTRTAIPTATQIPSPVPTRTPLPTATRTATPVPTATRPTATLTFTATPTNTPRPRPTSTPSLTPTNTALPSPTPTRTLRPTATLVPSATPSPTPTPIPTNTITPTPTATLPPIKLEIFFTSTSQIGTQMPPFNLAVTREVPGSANPITASLAEYFMGPTVAEQSQGLTVIRNGFAGYRRWDIADGVLSVYLAGTCESNGTPYSIAQPLIATLKQFAGVQYVKLYDGYDHTRDPLHRDDSWPACLDLRFTPTFTVTPTASITPSPVPSATPSPKPTLTPLPTATNTPRPTATPIPSATPTRTPIPTSTPIPPTRTPVPTNTATLTPLPTATLVPTFTPTVTPIPSTTPTRTPRPTETPRPTATTIPSETPTRTPAPTATPTWTPLPTAPPLPTRTPVPTLTSSPTSTFTPSATPRPTETPSTTPTRTPVPTPTNTPTRTPTRTPTPSQTPRPTSTPTLTFTPSLTPTPSITPSPTITRTPTITPTPTFDPRCNRAAFVGDVSIVDDTVFHYGEPLTKTWRIRNVGTCTWNSSYQLVFVGGDRFAGPNSVSIPLLVAPNQTVDVSVTLTAPGAPGEYQSFWQLQSPDGRRFGVGGSANGVIWVKIKVIPPLLSTATSIGAPSATAFIAGPSTATPAAPAMTVDFVNTVCQAQWQSNDGVLPCPGQAGDTRGFVVVENRAVLEDGSTASLPSLLTFPASTADGYILGLYPTFVVQPGDHFQATVSCEYKATGCSVLFRLSYLDSAGAARDLWSVGEFYDGKYSSADVDLSRLAGQQIRLVLSVGSLGSSTDDRALWVNPRIVHVPLSAPVITPTPAAPPRATSVAATATLAAPSSTVTTTPLPSATPSPAPTPAATPSPASPAQQVIDSILSFFRRLFGGR